MMNWSRSSKIALLGLVVIVVMAVPIAAVSVSQTGVPDRVQAGATVGVDSDVTVTLTDLYTDYQSYELVGKTDLRSAVWTVTTLNPQGEPIETKTFNSTSFTIDIGGSVDAVEVSIEGRAPSADAIDYRYDPPQSIVIASFAQRQSGGVASEIATITTRPYTSESDNARAAIQAASQAIAQADAAGASTEEADRLLGNAIEAFNNGDFNLAIDLAEQAESAAQSAEASQSQQELMLTVGVILVALLVVAGGVYWYLENRGPADKLG